MAKPLVELSHATSVDRAARALFGSVLDQRPAVSHSMAVWSAPESELLTTIRINEHSPKSDLDFLVLHIARARADAIVITGKILREEPLLTYDLHADPRWGNALLEWREQRWGLKQPPWLLILTSGRDLDFSHAVFDSWVRPLVFTSDRAAERRLADSPYPVVADASPDIRRAIDHLRQARDCQCVSIEAGPSTTRGLYDQPVAVEELLLSAYRAPELDDRAKGAPFMKLSELRAVFSSDTSALHEDPSGTWSFSRLCR